MSFPPTPVGTVSTCAASGAAGGVTYRASDGVARNDDLASCAACTPSAVRGGGASASAATDELLSRQVKVGTSASAASPTRAAGVAGGRGSRATASAGTPEGGRDVIEEGGASAAACAAGAAHALRAAGASATTT